MCLKFESFVNVSENTIDLINTDNTKYTCKYTYTHTYSE